MSPRHFGEPRENNFKNSNVLFLIIHILFFIFFSIISAYEIIRLKGYPSWAMALSVSILAGAILKNTRNVYAVSTFVEVLLYFYIIRVHNSRNS